MRATASDRLNEVNPGGWLVGIDSAVMAWSRNEADDPCFDLCSVSSFAGVIGAATTLIQLALPHAGLWYIDYKLCFMTDASGCIVRVLLNRSGGAGGANEVCDVLQSTLGSGSDNGSILCRISGLGGNAHVALRNEVATGAASNGQVLIRAKRLSR
jgi:hypothetical protein